MKKAILSMSAVVALAMPCFAGTDMVIDWNKAALNAIRTGRSNPPMATRGLAMMHTAMYDCVNAIDRAHEPFFVDANPPIGTSREAACATAAYEVLVHLYPNQIDYFDFVLYESLKKVADSQAKVDGIALGQFVAQQIIDWRATDGWDRIVPYEPGNLPGQWRPTPPGFLPALLPGWGQVTPWAMTGGEQFRAPAFPDLTSVEYANDVNETKALGDVDSQVRTPEQTEIAYFWADDPGTATPPGHWNVIAQDCAIAMGYGIGKNALLFAKLNVALADAAITCWDTKFHYNLWRPYHAITLADQDGNPLTEPDPTWMSLIVTPPFPEYTSGHSTFSAAAARILAYEFGTDQMSFTTTSDGTPGVYRSYTTFSSAAAEAGRSRIYGGIHYEFSNQNAQQAGRDLADWVQANFFGPMNDESPILCYPTYFRTEYINVFEAFHFTPGQMVVFVWDREIGSRSVPGCPGVMFDLNRPRRFGRIIADANGYAVVTHRVPIAFRDQVRYGQAVQRASCKITNLRDGYFPR
ncbi:MAG: vanadium-dependent haloperoxidase [Phycisphaerales bacterium]|nr:vanadium-dependent haloperoxidase [Phycisphaerales bacterium]